jgi:hypothetical protein
MSKPSVSEVSPPPSEPKTEITSNTFDRKRLTLALVLCAAMIVAGFIFVNLG